MDGYAFLAWPLGAMILTLLLGWGLGTWRLWLPVVLALVCAGAAVWNLATASGQSDMDGLGRIVLAFLFLAPGATGFALGAGLSAWRRRRQARA